MQELELKFDLPLSLQDSLEQEIEGHRWKAEPVWSCYYDTPDGELARARMALRVRRKGDAWLQTLKAEGVDQFQRFEWERPIDSATPQRDALPPIESAQGAIAHRSFALLRPVFETDFERRSVVVNPSESLAVEIAQDIGEVRCGDRSEAIREVELEVIEGSRADFFAWALDWAERHQSSLLLPTKNERGLRLAARLPLTPMAVKAGAATPGADLLPGRAAADALSACIAHALINIEPILRSDAPEGPHQFRVGLRRYRAALRFFGLRELDPVWAALDGEASALADAAGKVRDYDVFESGMLPQLRSRFQADAALEILSRAVINARESGRTELRRTLSGPILTQFVLRALGMAEQLADPDREPILPSDNYGRFAADRLPQLLGKIRRRARAARCEEDWHRARISVKNFRYALEFSAAAVPRTMDTAKMLSILARWQDQLGEGQDMAVARDVATTALARPGVPSEASIRATALIDGWRAFASPPGDGHGRGAQRILRDLRDLSSPLQHARTHRQHASGDDHSSSSTAEQRASGDQGEAHTRAHPEQSAVDVQIPRLGESIAFLPKEGLAEGVSAESLAATPIAPAATRVATNRPKLRRVRPRPRVQRARRR